MVATIFLAHVLKTAPPYGIYSPPHVRWYICIRGVLCAVGLVTAYTAMGCLTQSEFMTVYCCGPFATGIMCWVFVGERFSRLQGVCCCESRRPFPSSLLLMCRMYRHLPRRRHPHHQPLPP